MLFYHLLPYNSFVCYSTIRPNILYLHWLHSYLLTTSMMPSPNFRNALQLLLCTYLVRYLNTFIGLFLELYFRPKTEGSVVISENRFFTTYITERHLANHNKSRREFMPPHLYKQTSSRLLDPRPLFDCF